MRLIYLIGLAWFTHYNFTHFDFEKALFAECFFVVPMLIAIICSYIEDWRKNMLSVNECQELVNEINNSRRDSVRRENTRKIRKAGLSVGYDSYTDRYYLAW